MKQDSLNVIKYGTEEKAKLAETLGGILENVFTSAVSEELKAKDGSGDPQSGSVEYKRFANAKIEDKGTARKAGKGNAVKDNPITVNIDTDKEIIEEFQGKDLKLYGVPNMAERRKKNYSKQIRAYLDREFFACGQKEGTKIEKPTASATVQEIVDNMIVTAKTLKNDFIDGLDAEDLAIVLDATYRKKMKNVLDDLPNGTSPSNGAIGMYDSIIVRESTRMPAGCHVMLMREESIAQPFYVSEFDLEKINLDDAYALEDFLYKGTKALTPDTIFYYSE